MTLIKRIKHGFRPGEQFSQSFAEQETNKKTEKQNAMKIPSGK